VSPSPSPSPKTGLESDSCPSPGLENYICGEIFYLKSADDEDGQLFDHIIMQKTMSPLFMSAAGALFQLSSEY